MVFLKVGEFRWITPGQGENNRGISSSFLFVPEQLDSRRFKCGLFIAYVYHVIFLWSYMVNLYVVAGVEVT